MPARLVCVTGDYDDRVSSGEPDNPRRRLGLKKAPLNKHSAELVILSRRVSVESDGFLSHLNRCDYCASFLLKLFLPSRLSRNYHYPQTVRGKGFHLSRD